MPGQGLQEAGWCPQWGRISSWQWGVLAARRRLFARGTELVVLSVHDQHLRPFPGQALLCVP